MNSEREKADILFDYGLPLQLCCHLIQFYTLLFLRVATLMGAFSLSHYDRYSDGGTGKLSLRTFRLYSP